VSSPTTNLFAFARPVAEPFSPSRLALGLDNHSYTPSVLANIVFSGGDAKSFGQGEKHLRKLAELNITGRHVGRLTEKIGAELARKRDDDVAAYRRRELPAAVEVTPAVVVVETDGGRVQTRTPGQGFGVHEPHWREDKVACLCTLQSQESAADPHPEVPRCYLDRDYMHQLVEDVHGLRGAAKNEEKPEANADPPPNVEEVKPPAKTPRWQPERLVRTVVATMEDSEAFGPMVAAEAQRRDFFASARAAFVGDGQAYNWTIQRTWFPGFIDIVDFVHVTSYVYQAARASVGSKEDFWPTYVRWITAVWQGQVAQVLAELRLLVGPSAPAVPEAARLEALQESLTYLENNESRMAYPRYRRLGLPIVSALVESLVKEINWRVKGTEKFWNDSAEAEAILQVRAAILSEDDRLEKHIANRPGKLYRRERARAA
jgi:hypothetical protein